MGSSDTPPAIFQQEGRPVTNLTDTLREILTIYDAHYLAAWLLRHNRHDVSDENGTAQIEDHEKQQQVVAQNNAAIRDALAEEDKFPFIVALLTEFPDYLNHQAPHIRQLLLQKTTQSFMDGVDLLAQDSQRENFMKLVDVGVLSAFAPKIVQAVTTTFDRGLRILTQAAQLSMEHWDVVMQALTVAHDSMLTDGNTERAALLTKLRAQIMNSSEQRFCSPVKRPGVDATSSPSGPA